MSYGLSRVYGVSLSYLENNGERWVYYCELPAESESKALEIVRNKFEKENPLKTINPEMSVKLLYTDYWSA